MAWKLSNFAESTLSQAIALGDTTIYVDADEVDDLPSLGVGDKAKLVIFDASNVEIVNITAWNTNGTLTVERGREGTAARNWPAGTKVVHTPTAEVFAAILAVPAAVTFTGTATNVSNAYTVDVGTSNPVPSLSTGEEVSFVIPATNTGAATLVITDGASPTTAKPIVYQDNQPLLDGDLAEDWSVLLRFSEDWDAWVIVGLTSHQQYVTELNTDGMPAVNAHPNGNLRAWNNGTSFSTPASGTETADGWVVVYDGTIGAFTITRQNFLPGQTDVPGNPRHFIRWDQSGAGTASTIRRFRVKLKHVGWRAGETVIRSVWLKADTTRTVSAEIEQYFGTGGSPSANVVVGTESLSLTTSWQRFDIPITIPSISGKTIGTAGDDGIYLILDLPINVTMTIDVAEDDFRPGAIPGRYDDSFPWPWHLGGVGGSFDSAADFLLTLFPQLSAFNGLSSTGLVVRTSANTVAARSLTTATSGALTITNPGGVAGNPNIDVSTGLVNYAADPMSIAELASVTGVFGTAAFVADSGLVHIAGTETITGDKTFSSNLTFRRAVGSPLETHENTTTTHEMETRFASAGVLFELTPSPSGTPDTAKGFGYDFTNARWFSDTPLNLPSGSVSAVAVQIGAANQGFYSTGINIAVAVGGALAGFWTTAAFNSQLPIQHPNGAVGTPSWTWIAEPASGRYRLAANNYGESVNGTLVFDWNSSRLQMGVGMDVVLPATAVAPTSVYSAGFRGAPNVHGDKATNFQPSDATGAGSAIVFTATGTFTIPTNSSVAYPIGTVLFVPNLNGSGNVTIHPDTGVTLRRGDGTAGTGDRTLPPDAAIWLWKRGTNEWYIYGVYT